MNQTVPEWITEITNGGSHPYVDLHTGSNGWSTPPGDLFSIRSATYFTDKRKSPGGDYLLSPAGVDWLKSTSKLDHIMARPDNRVAQTLSKLSSPNKFVLAVNFQVPSKEPYSMVYYFATEKPIPSGSVLDRFINGDDSFRNQRFKWVSQMVKGPLLVRSVTEKYGAFVISKALTCSYYKGSNYFEIDVDVSSSMIMKTLARFVFGYVTSLTIDIGLLVEAQEEDELPEKLIGGVRLCQMELSSAIVVDR